MRLANPLAIAVALVRDGRPLIGIVHAPALQQTYVAVKDGGSRLNGVPIEVSGIATLDASARVGAPLFLAEELRQAGLTFTLQPRVLAGDAHRLCRFGSPRRGLRVGKLNDWDIAAADLILEEAGGRLAGLDGVELVYNREETRHGLLTAAPRQLQSQINLAMRRARGCAPG